MGRIAFVFSGQGDQYPGMGAELCGRYPAAGAVFERCDALRPGTSGMCFSGTEEELRQTRNTQPCLYAMETAAAQALKSCGLLPDAAAGFSLGELSALAFAGVMSPETGFSVVCRRGELMQRDAEKQDTAMCAVLKLSGEETEALCEDRPGFYPVNYNCPGQVTCAGPASAMPAFSEAVRAAGGRIVPLRVRGGFHSPYMAEAAAEFAGVIAATRLEAPGIPVYSNVTGEAYPDSPGALLAKQMTSPVRWEKTVRGMIGAGVDTFVEIGPGKTLCGLILRIDPGARVFAVRDYADLERLCAEVREC